MERLKRQQKFESQVKPNFIQRRRFYWSLKEKPGASGGLGEGRGAKV